MCLGFATVALELLKPAASWSVDGTSGFNGFSFLCPNRQYRGNEGQMRELQDQLEAEQYFSVSISVTLSLRDGSSCVCVCGCVRVTDTRFERVLLILYFDYRWLVSVLFKLILKQPVAISHFEETSLSYICFFELSSIQQPFSCSSCEPCK